MTEPRSASSEAESCCERSRCRRSVKLDNSPLRFPSTLHNTHTMAPLGEQLVDQLRGTVDKLEARVAELEARLHGKAAPSSSSTKDESMRIILMGPPGAGMPLTQIGSLLHTLTVTQERVPRLPTSRTSTASATSYVNLKLSHKYS